MKEHDIVVGVDRSKIRHVIKAIVTSCIMVAADGGSGRRGRDLAVGPGEPAGAGTGEGTTCRRAGAAVLARVGRAGIDARTVHAAPGAAIQRAIAWCGGRK